MAVMAGQGTNAWVFPNKSNAASVKQFDHGPFVLNPRIDGLVLIFLC